MAMNIPTHLLKKLPNLLTIGRIAVIPIIIPLYMLGFEWLNVFCAVLFAAAAATDYFDGYIARRYQVVTKFGAAFDHIADKLLVSCCLILLSASGVLPVPITIILILRELLVMGMRLVAAERRINIQVSSFGKVKTAVQDLAIFCLFINTALFAPTLRQVGMVSIWIATALSLYSAYLYWETFWPSIKDDFKS
jgi:CDP-diacylglycerol--glycerol-3-phosphate 3-phosphatidyltransferase